MEKAKYEAGSVIRLQKYPGHQINVTPRFFAHEQTYRYECAFVRRDGITDDVVLLPHKELDDAEAVPVAEQWPRTAVLHVCTRDGAIRFIKVPHARVQGSTVKLLASDVAADDALCLNAAKWIRIQDGSLADLRLADKFQIVAEV